MRVLPLTRVPYTKNCPPAQAQFSNGGSVGRCGSNPCNGGRNTVSPGSIGTGSDIASDRFGFALEVIVADCWSHWMREEQPSRPKSRRARREAGASSPTVPAWDRDDTGGDEAEEELREVTRMLDCDPDDPASVRLKVIRKKRIQSKWEKAIRRLALAGTVTAALIAAAVFVIGWSGSIRIAGQEKSGDIPPPPTMETPASAAMRSLEDRAAAVRVIAKFVATEDWQDCGRWVLNADEVLPLMADWYTRHPWSPFGEFTVIRCNNQDDGERAMVVAAIVAREGETLPFLVHKTADGMKIDWKATVSYQPMGLDQFVQTRPTNPLEFRVHVGRGRQNAPPFNNHDTYRAYALQLVTYPKNKRTFRAYARRGSEADLMLNTLLRFKRTSSAIVKLRYPPGEEGSPDVIEITGFVGASLAER